MIFFHRKLFSKLRRLTVETTKWIIRRAVSEIVITETHTYGDPSRLHISPSAAMVNTLYNTSSGSIVVGDYTFTGHNVSLITGSHNYESLLLDRLRGAPTEGRDIVIGKGVWICSNATILGPCEIGDHAVIGAGSVVTPGTVIKEKTIYAGVPAKLIKNFGGIEQDGVVHEIFR